MDNPKIIDKNCEIMFVIVMTTVGLLVLVVAARYMFLCGIGRIIPIG